MRLAVDRPAAGTEAETDAVLFLLDPGNPRAPFPAAGLAETDPNGLLAVGGDLHPERLINAYRNGIFPWFSPGDPILWWSPDPRTLLFPAQVRVSRSLRKALRRRRLGVTMDRAFDAVIRACSGPRRDGAGTWLVPEMIAAYGRLHRRGLAHSVEVWQDGELVGGLYGVGLGRVFYGESMFSRVGDASKVALVHLCQRLDAWGFAVVDCQMMSGHLVRMGAQQVQRDAFTALLRRWCPVPGREGSWDDGAISFPLPEGTATEPDEASGDGLQGAPATAGELAS
jgi:leucyl/phenylalanyl-tRNA--protein transferase